MTVCALMTGLLLQIASYSSADSSGASIEADRRGTAVETPFLLVEHRASPMRSNDNINLGSEIVLPRMRHIPATRYGGVIGAAERRHRLPAGLLQALVRAESSYVAGAVSERGATGLAQLMPLTAKLLGVIDPLDPWQNIDAGGRYLRMLLDQFGSISLALAAYNAGPGAVRRSGGIPMYAETRRYVRQVLNHWRDAVGAYGGTMSTREPRNSTEQCSLRECLQPSPFRQSHRARPIRG